MKNVTKPGKLMSKFHKAPFEVIDKRGSMIVAMWGDEIKAQNSSHFKPVICGDEYQFVNSEDLTQDLDPVQITEGSQPGPVESMTNQQGSMPDVTPEQPHIQDSANRTPVKNTSNRSQPNSEPVVWPRRQRKPLSCLSDYEVCVPKKIWLATDAWWKQLHVWGLALHYNSYANILYITTCRYSCVHLNWVMLFCLFSPSVKWIFSYIK